LSGVLVDINASDDAERSETFLPQQLETAMDMSAHHPTATNQRNFKFAHPCSPPDENFSLRQKV
jgi:hypothetical protein